MLKRRKRSLKSSSDTYDPDPLTETTAYDNNSIFPENQSVRGEPQHISNSVSCHEQKPRDCYQKQKKSPGRSRKDVKGDISKRPMLGRMNGFFSPSTIATPIKTNSGKPTTSPGETRSTIVSPHFLPRSLSSGSPAGVFHPKISSNVCAKAGGRDVSMKSRELYQQSLPQSTMRDNVLRNGTSRNAVNQSATSNVPHHIIGSRMTSGQRILSGKNEPSQQPKARIGARASERKDVIILNQRVIAKRQGLKGKAAERFIDLTIESPSVRSTPSPLQHDELVSDSDDDSLQISDDRTGLILEDSVRVANFSVPSGREENCCDVVDLSMDDPPAESRLKRRKNTGTKLTSFPIGSKLFNRNIYNISKNIEAHSPAKNPNGWNKVSEPLRDFDKQNDLSLAFGDVEYKDARSAGMRSAVRNEVPDPNSNIDRANISACSGRSVSDNIRISYASGDPLFDSLDHSVSFQEKEAGEFALSSHRNEMHLKEKITSSRAPKKNPSVVRRAQPHLDVIDVRCVGKLSKDAIVLSIPSQDEVLEVTRTPKTVPSASPSTLQERSRCSNISSRNKVDNVRLRPLSEQELGEVRAVTRGVWKQQPIAFVKEANITLKGQDFACLRGSRWLNDEVMNSFMALLNARNDKYHGVDDDVIMTDVRDAMGVTRVGGLLNYNNDERVDCLKIFKQPRPRVHAFNTFFFSRMTQGNGYDYRGVQRWLRRAKKHVRDLDLIFVPINLSNFHWVLAVIDIRNRQFLYFDSMMGSVVMNSVDILKRWLFDEVCDKASHDAANNMGVERWRIIINPNYLPRQHDTGSCGIFTLYIAEYLERGVKPDFTQRDIFVLRQRTVLFLRHGKLPEN